MCGICGLYHYHSGAPAGLDLVRSMTASIIHRGPDDEGHFCDGPMGFGMRRLSIIDLNSGHQPIHNEDETVWIVFNGEIYNFLELKRELENKGHVFYTRSDTEVILHGYEEWGEDCVLRLNGIFGFAVWDSRLQRLFMARDHFGVKPLYYHDNGVRLLFGSEVKAILQDPGLSRDVDLEALDLFLTFRFVPSPYTMFKGIRKLPPGHSLICDRSGCRVARFWKPTPPSGRLDADEYTVLLQQRLEEAVCRQMISDVPIGALLSGGIDSAAVVAIMKQLTDQPIQTFTVGFKNGGSVNELDDARGTAKLLGTEHHEILLDSLDYERLLEKVIWHLDEPIATTSALAMFFVCELARKYVKVVLTGQGADEPHAGYHRYLGEKYGHLYRSLPAPLRDEVIWPLVEALPRQERAKRAVRSLSTEDVDSRFMQIYSVFSETMKQELWRPEIRPNGAKCLPRKVVSYWREGVEHLDPLLQMSYVDARLSLPDDLLIYGDKMSMANSVEARVPFLDLDYMAVAETLPGSLRIHRLSRKYIHRRAVAKWLPSSIIRRKKRGFETPVDVWFRSELTGYVKRSLLSPDSACGAYFDPAEVEALLREHVTGRQDNRRQLFSLLVFELWHRRFIR